MQQRTAKDMADAMIEAEKLKIDRAEVAIEAESKGVQLDQAMRDSEDRTNLELLRIAEGRRGSNKGGKKEE